MVCLTSTSSRLRKIEADIQLPLFSGTPAL
jgi:hypothetical protein